MKRIPCKNDQFWNTSWKFQQKQFLGSGNAYLLADGITSLAIGGSIEELEEDLLAKDFVDPKMVQRQFPIAQFQ